MKHSKMNTGKRLLLLLLLAAASIQVDAQLITASSLTVKEIKRELPPVKTGYQQSVDVGFSYLGYWPNVYFGLEYIGGWRFNELFYVGAGTGLEFNVTGNGSWSYGGYYLNEHVLYVPLYAHARVYLGKKKVMPYFALSVGGMLSTKGEISGTEISYGTSRFILEPAVGADFRLYNGHSIYVNLAYMLQTMPEVIACYGHSAMIQQVATHGFSLHIGYTF